MPLRGPAGVIAVTVLCALLGSSGGCGTTQAAGNSLSVAGVNTSDSLAGLYETLATAVEDKIELETLANAFRDDTLEAQARARNEAFSVDAETRKQRANTRQLDLKTALQLRRRAAMARRLSDLYQALGGLAANPAKPTVGDAARNLAGAVRALDKDSLEGGPDPTDLVGMLAQDLITIQNANDVRVAGQRIDSILAGVRALYDGESRVKAYRVIIERRGDVAGNVTRVLVERGWADPVPILRRLAESKGIPWDGQFPRDDAVGRRDAAAVASLVVSRTGDAAVAATEEMGLALKELSAQHQVLAASGRPDLRGAVALAGRVKEYLDEVHKLQKAAQEQREQQQKKEEEAERQRRKKAEERGSPSTVPAGPQLPGGGPSN